MNEGEFWSQLSTPLKYLLVLTPVVTAMLTVVFGTVLSHVSNRKDRRVDKRPYFTYTEYILDYPIKEGFKGDGLLLLGDNGRKLFPMYQSPDHSQATFFVLQNISRNDVLNLEIQVEFSDNKSYIKEKFVLPVWESEDVIYIPQTIFNSSSMYSTNEKLMLTFNSTALEKLRFGFRKTRKGLYIERYKRRFLFFWFTILKNESRGLTRVEIVRKTE